MKLVYVGDATFVEKEPVDLTDTVVRELTLPKAPKVYWYVRFFSLERAGYGLALLTKGPKSKWIDHEEIREQTFDPTVVAPLTEFSEGLELLEEGRRSMLEEYPFVEVTKEEDYKKALAAFLKESEGPREWSPRNKLEEESNWKGPGVYDFRDMTLHTKSVEQYEIDGMEYWAKDVLDTSEDDDWEETLKKLLERNL
jgi:hypothetical protein